MPSIQAVMRRYGAVSTMFADGRSLAMPHAAGSGIVVTVLGVFRLSLIVC